VGHLIAALRRYGETPPNLRQGKNTTYAMAGFALAAFSPFFYAISLLPGPSAASRNRPWRSNCQSVFGMRKIARDGQVRVMLDTVARRNLPRCSAMFWR